VMAFTIAAKSASITNRESDRVYSTPRSGWVHETSMEC
jgi:hypothetical protein